jgi:hypothetical protein
VEVFACNQLPNERRPTLFETHEVKVREWGKFRRARTTALRARCADDALAHAGEVECVERAFVREL